MPKAEVTTRYKDFGDNDQSYYAKLKKQEREKVLKNYPGAADLQQRVITDGIPDMISLGELRAKGMVAIRTEFIISDEQAAALKAKVR